MFQINLHKNDSVLLENIQLFFGNVGKIYKKKKKESLSYAVESKKLLPVIIDHCFAEKYPPH